MTCFSSLGRCEYSLLVFRDELNLHINLGNLTELSLPTLYVFIFSTTVDSDLLFWYRHHVLFLVFS